MFDFEQVIYVVGVVFFFAVSLRILMALHLEKNFQKFKIWEIKMAYVIIALVLAHNLAEFMVRIIGLFDGLMP